MVQNEKTFKEKRDLLESKRPENAPIEFEAEAVSVSIDNELTTANSSLPVVTDNGAGPFIGSVEGLAEDQKAIKVNAGVASGVAGLLICGPIMAILLGFGAAYAVDKDVSKQVK